MMSEILCKADYEKAIATTRDDRMGWFREARFGMFVHYGIYSLYGRNRAIIELEFDGDIERCVFGSTPAMREGQGG